MSDQPDQSGNVDPRRKLAADLFNMVWSLMENEKRTKDEDDMMIHAAHASRYHWTEIGSAVNLARGEWQISRVYCVLHRAEPALFHARRCLEICEENHIGDFDLAYAYEAMARSYAVAGNTAERDRYLRLAHEAGEHIEEDDDKELFYSDLQGIIDGEEPSR
jgi:hypothetical protein